MRNISEKSASINLKIYSITDRILLVCVVVGIIAAIIGYWKLGIIITIGSFVLSVLVKILADLIHNRTLAREFRRDFPELARILS